MDRLAHTALGAHSEAKACYQRALELDPVNETYQENLRQSEQLSRDDNVSLSVCLSVCLCVCLSVIYNLLLVCVKAEDFHKFHPLLLQ